MEKNLKQNQNNKHDSTESSEVLAGTPKLPIISMDIFGSERVK
jgi:hypothetical protein